MHIGRVISTAIVGLFFALFVAIDLVLFGVVPNLMVGPIDTSTMPLLARMGVLR